MSFSFSTTKPKTKQRERRDYAPKLFVTCHKGHEELLQKELEALQITGIIPRRAGLMVDPSWDHIFTINHFSRLAIRVLFPIATFNCRDKEQLYNNVKKISWLDWLRLSDTLAIDANIGSSQTFNNSHFAALVVKDAIVDTFREEIGKRPSIDIKNPSVQLNLSIFGEQATLYYDTSLTPLYRRGWRKEAPGATLEETTASAICEFAGYEKGDTLLDPYAGSGTLLVEAALYSSNTPPSFFRKNFGYQTMPKVPLYQMTTNIEILPPSFYAYDTDSEALEKTKEHFAVIGQPGALTIIDINKPPTAIDWIITDPPLGKRMETSYKVFEALGDLIRQVRPKKGFAFLAAHPRHAEITHLPISRKVPINLGGFDVHLYMGKLNPLRLKTA